MVLLDLNLIAQGILFQVGTSHAMLVGASRKGFLGRIVGGTFSFLLPPIQATLSMVAVCHAGEAESKPKLRGWGTAATSTAAVVGGANIVRVHDVKEQGDVIKVADAIYRNNWTSTT